MTTRQIQWIIFLTKKRTTKIAVSQIYTAIKKTSHIPAIQTSVRQKQMQHKHKNVTVENCTQTENDNESNKLTNPYVANNIAKELKEMLDVVVKKLSLNSKLHLTLLTFFKLIVMDLFPLDNIAILVWSDVVRWFDTSNTTDMPIQWWTQNCFEK